MVNLKLKLESDSSMSERFLALLQIACVKIWPMILNNDAKIRLQLEYFGLILIVINKIKIAVSF